MRVFHPVHRTAWSSRTTGYPVYALSSEGVVGEMQTTKRACYWEVPDGVKYLAWCYRTNRGHRAVHFLLPKDGLPEVATLSSFDSPEDLRGFLKENGLEACMETLEGWLWG